MADPRVIDGACHCGNVRYELSWPAHEFPITTRECSCSFCQKHGAVYTSHPRSALTLHISDEDKVVRYRFGHETADFIICRSCGSLMCAISHIDGHDYAVINVNNFENIDAAELVHSVTDFDLESIAVRLARRKKKWTPDVRFSRL
ncbi:MAG: GFA family protein [Gammaproteobacteria bacterium]